MRLGRNEPCHCGSGRKYKRCCFGSDQSTQTARSVRAELPLGLPGQYMFFRFEPIFPDGDPRCGKPPIGPFDITYTLARPGHLPSPDSNLQPEENHEGDSHLAIARPAIPHDAKYYRIESIVNGKLLRADGIPNKRGFLGKIRITGVDAPDAYAAEELTYGLVSPPLSHIAMKLDIPLFLWQVDIRDVPTGNYYMRYAAPHQPGRMANVEALYDPEAAAILSIYREALNSNTPVFQFLCYYKIIERLLQRRGELSVKEKAAGGQPTHAKLLVPLEPKELREWLASVWPSGIAWSEQQIDEAIRKECRGRSVSDIRDRNLQPLRDSVAHDLFEAGSISYSIDDPESVKRINKWLSTAKTLARFIMNTDIPVASKATTGTIRFLCDVIHPDQGPETASR